jgi:hypothetical protein
MIENNLNNNLENKTKIKIPMIKIKTLKSGEIKEYIYDQKPYNDKYYNKNKDTINKKIFCEICQKNIFRGNLKKHNDSITHFKEREIKNLNIMNNTEQTRVDFTKQTKCECGSIYLNNNKRYHTSTKKHISYMNNIEEKILNDLIKEDENITIFISNN